MKPLGLKLCCLIDHMTTMGVATLCLSLPSGDHREGIQKYLIPIYQVGNQCFFDNPVIGSSFISHSCHYCSKLKKSHQHGMTAKWYMKPRVSASRLLRYACLDCLTFTGIMAAIFALDELVDMMSIGTLMAYTLVACSVLLLRWAYPTFRLNIKAWFYFHKSNILLMLNNAKQPLRSISSNRFFDLEVLLAMICLMA